jgi:alkylation response protein AidB-like acyl-CoA dehydrogenase
MHPAHTPEQQELKDAVRRFCAEQITPARLAAWEREPRGIDERSWKAIADLGWFGLGLPVAAGGSGLGLVEVACLLQECARGLVPRSVIAAVRGGWALAGLGADAPELAPVASGEQTVSLAFDEEKARDPERYETRYDERGQRLRGAKCYVSGAMSADFFLVPARAGDEIASFLVSREHVQLVPLRTFDGDRQAMVRFDEAAARRLTPPGQGPSAVARLRREQAALALAEMIGGMEAVLDMTVNYTKEREQFGQKIAVFQAVQHQVADMGTAMTASRHLSWQAITRLAAGTENGGELEAALAYVGQAFKRMTFTAHHLHGGAGFVVEHPLHYHSERAQSLCIRYAPEADMLAAIAARLLD